MACVRAWIPVACFCVLIATDGCSRSETAVDDVRPSGVESPPARIVLIVVDMLRRDYLGAYGAARPTPRIDAIAQAGQVVQGALSSYVSTRKSMAALFTGRTPSLETGRVERTRHRGPAACGMARFATRAEHPCLPRELPSLAEGMKSRGYSTLGVTSNVYLYDPAGFSRGFDVWLESGAQTREERMARQPRLFSGAYGGTLAASVNAAVRDALDRRPDDHFFLYVHFMDVHDHMVVRESYADGVARADHGIGVLLDELDSRGLLNDTLILLTSDHGERLGERHPIKGRRAHYGNPAFDYVVQVPLIASRPVLPEAGPPIRGQDVMPLLLSIAGETAPTPMDVEPDELFLSEWVWQVLRKGDWKLMRRRFDGQQILFDIANDPSESQDVVAEHTDVAERLAARLDALTESLAARQGGRMDFNEEELRRMEALGYVEEAEDPASSHESASQAQ